MTSVAATVFAEVAAPQQAAAGVKPEAGLFGAVLQQAQAEALPPPVVAGAAAGQSEPVQDVAALATLLVFGGATAATPDQPEPPPPASAALVADAEVETDETAVTPPLVMQFPAPSPRLPAAAEAPEPADVLAPVLAVPGATDAPALLAAAPEPDRLPAEPQVGAVGGALKEPLRLPGPAVTEPSASDVTAEGPNPVAAGEVVLPENVVQFRPSRGKGSQDRLDDTGRLPVEGVPEEDTGRLPVSDLRDILPAPAPKAPAADSRLPVVPLPVGSDQPAEPADRGDLKLGDSVGLNPLPWTPARPTDVASPAPTEPARLPAEPLNHTRLAGEVHSMVLTGQNEARLNLEPADLGQVVVRLLLEDGRVAVDLQAFHAEAREALETALPGLQSALEQQGLRVEGISVSAETAGWSGGAGQGASGGWQGQQRLPWQGVAQRPSGYPEPPREGATAGQAVPGTNAGNGIDYRV